jgi:hypothetical protein
VFFLAKKFFKFFKELLTQVVALDVNIIKSVSYIKYSKFLVYGSVEAIITRRVCQIQCLRLRMNFTRAGSSDVGCQERNGRKIPAPVKAVF